VAQINFDADDIPGHLEKIKQIIADYSTSELIVFPELIIQGHPSGQKPEGYLYRQIKVFDTEIFSSLHKFIQEKGARVILGELRRHGENYYNQASYIDRMGVQSYRKTHVHWTERFVPGNRLRLFHSPFGKIGINICFDSAFSEVWRVLALQGAEIIVNISAVPAHFPVEFMQRRLSGAAVFNQVFVVYANRPGPYFSGHSAVYGPRGEELAALGSQEALLHTEIDLEDLSRWRKEEPLYGFRRPLLYRAISSRGKLSGRRIKEPHLRLLTPNGTWPEAVAASPAEKQGQSPGAGAHGQKDKPLSPAGRDKGLGHEASAERN